MRFKLPKNSHAYASIRRCLATRVRGGDRSAKVEAYGFSEPRLRGWLFVRVFGRKPGPARRKLTSKRRPAGPSEDFLLFDREILRRYEDAREKGFVKSLDATYSTMNEDEWWVFIVASQSGVACDSGTEVYPVSFTAWPPRAHDPEAVRNKKSNSRGSNAFDMGITVADVEESAFKNFRYKGVRFDSSPPRYVPEVQFNLRDLSVSSLFAKVDPRAGRMATIEAEKMLENAARYYADTIEHRFGPLTFTRRKFKNGEKALVVRFRNGLKPVEVWEGRHDIAGYARKVARKYDVEYRRWIRSWKRYVDLAEMESK